MKNHKVIDGHLLQNNKKYSHLKLKQKNRIAEWMYQETKEYYEKQYVFPDEEHLDDVVKKVYDRIEQAEIWIPYEEVRHHYKKKRSDLNSRVRRELNVGEEKYKEKACFMNLCMIQDEQGNVLALDKMNDSYTGTTFPGGHVEPGEPFREAVIREVREETGLVIQNPELCGIYHWNKAHTHNMIFLYQTKDFSGELQSSDEGPVYWISMEEFMEKELAKGMKEVMEIMMNPNLQECYMRLEKGVYQGTLY